MNKDKEYTEIILRWFIILSALTIYHLISTALIVHLTRGVISW